MGFEYANAFVPISVSTKNGVDLEVSNGMLQDGNGNNVYVGVNPSGYSYNGVADLYVNQVYGATPTGNLKVKNDAPYVVGYGEVALTNPFEGRVCENVGNAGGEEGSIKTNSNGSLYIEYEEETWDNKRFEDKVTQVSGLPASQGKDVPSDADNVELTGGINLNGGDATINVVFDKDGDGVGEDTETITQSGEGGSFTNRTHVGTGTKGVEAGSNYSDSDNDADFNHCTAIINYDVPTTTTTTSNITFY